MSCQSLDSRIPLKSLQGRQSWAEYGTGICFTLIVYILCLVHHLIRRFRNNFFFKHMLRYPGEAFFLSEASDISEGPDARNCLKLDCPG